MSQYKEPRPAGPGQVFLTVTMSLTPNSHGWGDDCTLRILDPDGSVYAEASWGTGPDGPQGDDDEADMAEWLGEGVREYLFAELGATAERMVFNEYLRTLE